MSNYPDSFARLPGEGLSQIEAGGMAREEFNDKFGNFSEVGDYMETCLSDAVKELLEIDEVSCRLKFLDDAKRREFIAQINKGLSDVVRSADLFLADAREDWIDAAADEIA